MAKTTKKRPSRGRAAATKKPVKAARRAAKKVSAIPAGYHALTPYLVFKNAGAAMDFYKKAFGAKETVRMNAPDGSIMHAEMRIGDSSFMMGEEFPSMNVKSPETLGGTPAGLMWYTPDVDKAFARAVAAGATAEQPPTDMFWGDRYAKLVDPFGHRWSIATHVEDVPPKEMDRRAREAMAQMSANKG